MNFNIIPTELFERELKRLAKRHLSLKSDLATLMGSLTHTPNSGQSIGNNCYKIRLAVTSKGKGKSGGARVITYVKIIEKDLYLLSIYDKSDTDTITDREILERIKDL